MKKVVLFAIVFLEAIGVLIFWFYGSQNKNQKVENVEEPNISNQKSTMNLSSPAFSDNGSLPAKYSCDGEKVNPPLVISDVPEKAVSLVLIVDDPDAPRRTYTHWTVWNIKPGTKEIKENSVPDGAIQGKTSANRSGYAAACPPLGIHSYTFKMYALDTMLDLPSSADVEDLTAAMDNHILDRAQIIGKYGR